MVGQRFRAALGPVAVAMVFLCLTVSSVLADEYIRRFTYVVQPGDTLGSILVEQSVIGNNPMHPLYSGWVKRNKALNPGVDWRNLEPGTTLILEVPVRLPEPAKVRRAPTNDPQAAANQGADGEAGEDDDAAIVQGGYIGLRYGPAVGKSDNELLKKTAMAGVFAEFRGGWFAGLRYYYDVVPVVSARINGVGVEYGWQRHSLGYAFGWDLPAFADRIHFTPKLGHHSLKARFPRQKNGVFESETFSTKALSLGLELDLEWRGRFGTIRPWFGQEFSGSQLGREGQDDTSSRRLGLDTYWDLPGFGNSRVGLAFLVFVLNENVTLTGGEEDDDDDNAADDDFEIGVGVTYAGAGISIYW